eukprot:scaffold4420_cov135-Skeletonema_dohrnii-CCMP3373.AAC.2
MAEMLMANMIFMGPSCSSRCVQVHSVISQAAFRGRANTNRLWPLKHKRLYEYNDVTNLHTLLSMHFCNSFGAHQIWTQLDLTILYLFSACS